MADNDSLLELDGIRLSSQNRKNKETNDALIISSCSNLDVNQTAESLTTFRASYKSNVSSGPVILDI